MWTPEENNLAKNDLTVPEKCGGPNEFFLQSTFLLSASVLLTTLADSQQN